MADAKVIPFPIEKTRRERISVNDDGTATVRDPEPAMFDATAAAITEGRHILDQLSEGYIQIGAGDPAVEVIRQLIQGADSFGTTLQNTLHTLQVLGAQASQAMSQLG